MTESDVFGAEKIRVAIIDDHSLVRQGLRTVLLEESDIELVGEAENAAGAMRLLEAMRPDVALVDVTLPDRHGLELVSDLRELVPQTQLIVITIHDNELYLLEAIQAGAAGYLLKDSHHSLIPLAVRSVVANGCTVERRLLQRLLSSIPTLEPALDRQSAAISSQLSEREASVLRLISQGQSNRDIAGELCLAESTVKKYVQSLKTKLNVSGRAQAAALAVRLRLDS